MAVACGEDENQWEGVCQNCFVNQWQWFVEKTRTNGKEFVKIVSLTRVSRQFVEV